MAFRDALSLRSKDQLPETIARSEDIVGFAFALASAATVEVATVGVATVWFWSWLLASWGFVVPEESLLPEDVLIISFPEGPIWAALEA